MLNYSFLFLVLLESQVHLVGKDSSGRSWVVRQTCIPPEEPLDLDEQHPSLSSWPVMRTPGVVMQFDDSQGPIQI